MRDREDRKEQRERERARQYRGDVLRASCKRVVSWILWTLHGETTTKTKWIPERDRRKKQQPCATGQSQSGDSNVLKTCFFLTV